MHCKKTMFGTKQKPLVLRFFPRTFFLALAAICHEMNFPEKKKRFQIQKRHDLQHRTMMWNDKPSDWGRQSLPRSQFAFKAKISRDAQDVRKCRVKSSGCEVPARRRFCIFGVNSIKIWKMNSRKIKAERMFHVKANKRRRKNETHNARRVISETSIAVDGKMNRSQLNIFEFTSASELLWACEMLRFNDDLGQAMPPVDAYLMSPDCRVNHKQPGNAL
jgi:hypothetical protein